MEDFFNVMGAPVDMAVYRDSPGWNDWYDTEESQKILKYQNRSYEYYSDQMKAIIEEMMASDYENLLQVFDSNFGSFVILER